MDIKDPQSQPDDLVSVTHETLSDIVAVEQIRIDAVMANAAAAVQSANDALAQAGQAMGAAIGKPFEHDLQAIQQAIQAQTTAVDAAAQQAHAAVMAAIASTENALSKLR